MELLKNMNAKLEKEMDELKDDSAMSGIHGTCMKYKRSKDEIHIKKVCPSKNNNTLLAKLKFFIEELFRFFFPRIHKDTFAKSMMDIILNENLFDGSAKSEVFNVYDAYRTQHCPLTNGALIAEAMDLNDYKVNHEALHVLRRISNNDGMNGWIASHRSVTNAMNNVNELTNEIIPYELIPGVDGVKFHYEKLLIYCLKIFNLYDIAKTDGNILLAITLDQADISTNICHVTAGVKFIDKRGHDPITGLPIGSTNSLSPQSRDVCVPFKMILIKDSKEVYETYFRDFFEYFTNLEKNPPDGLKPFIVVSPQDMSSHWKTVLKGGAAKRDNYFCHCCKCDSKSIIKPRDSICKTCEKKGKKICYHWPVGDKTTIERIKQELQELENSPEFKILDNIDIKKMKTHYNYQADPESDISSLDYLYVTTEKKLEYFNEYIRPDLELCGLPIIGKIEDHQYKLKAIWKCYHKREQLKLDQLSGDHENAMVQINQAVPCILHCEIRIGEKIIKMLLLKALKERPSGEYTSFVKTFQDHVNSKILGTESCKGNWSIPSEGKGKGYTIGKLSISNLIARKFMDKFDALVDLCIKDKKNNYKWKMCVQMYKEVINLARQREDFTDEQIELFQDKADEFFINWIELNNKDGVTNYIHMLGSGHFKHFLTQHRNLYAYSQQGWESLNSLIKQFYFRRTQQGGNSGTRDTKNSRIIYIIKWVQRKLYWQFQKVEYRRKFQINKFKK
jgi:hypothetical protein